MVPYPITSVALGGLLKAFKDSSPISYSLCNMCKIALIIPAFLRRVTEPFSNGLRKMYRQLQCCIFSPEQQSGKF